jgi:hypothetical protein
MKKIIVTGFAGAAIAAGLGFAAPAQATCVINSTTPVANSPGICAPDLQASVQQSLDNLKKNLSPAQAAQNLKDNTDPGTALGNLQHALTHGVGSDDPAD